jgi:hypothetical protein
MRRTANAEVLVEVVVDSVAGAVAAAAFGRRSESSCARVSSKAA